MRSYDTTGSTAPTRKPAPVRTAVSPDICEFLDMLSAIENRSAGVEPARN